MNTDVRSGPRTVRDWVFYAEKRFAAAGLYFGHGTDNARDEAAWLVCAMLGIDSASLDSQRARPVTAVDGLKLGELIEQRITTRKPLAYLLREAWFAGLRFYVDERVLVPRSLTGEFILARFQPWIEPEHVRRALDLCTGSGCIAVALARAFPRAHVDAVDISLPALDVAHANIAAHGLADRIDLLQSDLFAALPDRRYDLIVTNPPYVDAADMHALPPEFRHEPALALAAGNDGLDVVVRILAEAADRIADGGILVMETGNSCRAVRAAFPQVKFHWLRDSRGDDSVLLLSAEQLRLHRGSFESAR